MKDGSLYFIRIVTCSEGKESVFTAPVALVREADGFTFSYVTYGGPTKLFLSHSRLLMERQGENAFSCIFEEGKEGKMLLSSGNFTASLPVRTRSLKILPTQDIFEAQLAYDLKFDEHFVSFTLDIHIFSGGPMKIVYFGHSCFALQSGAGTTVVTDPYGDVGLGKLSLSANILTVSHGHYDHSNISAVSHVYLFDKAGEYKHDGISIDAYPSFHDQRGGALRGRNLIFSFEIDGFRVVHLGDSGVKAEDLPKGLSPDILLLPVGGNYTIDATEAMRYIEHLSPKIVIPMHYHVEGLTVDIEGVEHFVRLAKEKYPVEFAGCEWRAEGLPETTKIIVMERKKL